MSTTTTIEPLVSIAHAARAAGLPYSLLRRLVIQRRIPSVSVAGRTLVRTSEVRAAIVSIPAAV